jgi:small multidrug resistance pump
MNAWTYLAIGIVFEVIGTTCLKLSNGFTEITWSCLCVACFVAAMYVLSLSVKTLDISIVYAIWSGVGITLISFIGVFFFQEQVTFLKFFFIALIVIGVAGLQIVTPSR